MTRSPAIRNPISAPIPPSFHAKKSQILRSLNQPTEAYTDNSPKGTVDAQIRDLIAEINVYEGFVTTSSCAGRVAVFVEGPRPRPEPERKCNVDAKVASTSTSTSTHSIVRGGEGRDFGFDFEGQDEEGDEAKDLDKRDVVIGGGSGSSRSGVTRAAPSTSPGGKGGGRWLFVSHDRIPLPGGRSRRTTTTTTTTTTTETNPGTETETDAATVPGEYYFSRLFNLDCAGVPTPPLRTKHSYQRPPPRLVHLTFSPLILHIHCASLRHARPLLAAAINAGFRESGVQSLRVLDPAEADKGVMVAVRTAGLGFDTVVGCVAERGEDGDHIIRDDDDDETFHRVVGEEYLRMCVEVVNERFGWNEERRERFRAELRRAMEREGLDSGVGAEEVGEQDQGRSRLDWEDKEARRRRKREEGLARQMKKREEEKEGSDTTDTDAFPSRQEVDSVDRSLNVLEIG
jgi:tRNA wybutosine-synthesizing protein 3